jgi:integrase
MTSPARDAIVSGPSSDAVKDPLEAMIQHAEGDRPRRSQHTGNIIYLGDSRWRIRVSGGFDADGKRIQRSKTISGQRRDAERVAATMQLQHGTNALIPSNGTVKVGELLMAWQDAHADIWTPGNIDTTRTFADNKLRPLHSKEVDRLSTQDVRRFYAGLQDEGLAPSSVRRIHSSLRSAMAWGVSEGLTTTNPAAQIRKLSAKNKPTVVPTVKAVKAMIDAADPWQRGFLRFALASGARRGEMAALRWADIDIKSDYATVSFERRISGTQVVEGLKATGAKTIKLPATLVNDLRAASMSDVYVFGTGDAPSLPDKLTKSYGRAKESVLVNNPSLEGSTLHCLRHLCGSMMLKDGATVAQVSKHLGHSSPAITMQVYLHDVGDNDTLAADLFKDL